MLCLHVFSEGTYNAEFQHFQRGQEAIVKEVPSLKVPGLKPQQVVDMMRLAKLPAFRNITKNIENNPVSCYTLFSFSFLICIITYMYFDN